MSETATHDYAGPAQQMTSRWRHHAAPIIARVLEETKGKPDKEIRAALRTAYPFGPRKHHPYRIWCDEIRVQTRRRRAPKPDDRQQALLLDDPQV